MSLEVISHSLSLLSFKEALFLVLLEVIPQSLSLLSCKEALSLVSLEVIPQSLSLLSFKETLSLVADAEYKTDIVQYCILLVYQSFLIWHYTLSVSPTVCVCVCV